VTNRLQRLARARPRLLLVGAGALAAVALTACNVPTFGGFRGSTTQGQSEFKLWVGFAIAGLIVAVFVWSLIFWAVIRYRRKSDELPKQTRYNVPWEIAYYITPVIIVAVLFAVTVATENSIDAVSATPGAQVRVVAFQWGWRFTYQGTPVSIYGNYNSPPQLVLPGNETTRITLVSNDVVHGFYVPEFNFSRFAQPGVTNVFDFTPTKYGTFRGQCTQYCGLYHSEMLFSVRVMPSRAYQSWLSLQTSRARAVAA
jgi:cytochrome c oxidase subunit 2